MSNKILNILCALVGIGMIVFGANKLVPFLPMPNMSEQQKMIFGAFGTIKWLMPLIGIVEIIGGLLLAIPKTKALGAIVLLPVIVGIITHLLVHDPSTIGIGAFFGVVVLWAIIDNKDRYMHMIK